jgi:hypothetical protein
MKKQETYSRVLKDLHKIRRIISKETDDMTAEEEINYWHQMVEEGLKESGFRLIITPQGKKILRETK